MKNKLIYLNVIVLLILQAIIFPILSVIATDMSQSNEVTTKAELSSNLLDSIANSTNQSASLEVDNPQVTFDDLTKLSKNPVASQGGGNPYTLAVFGSIKNYQYSDVSEIKLNISDNFVIVIENENEQNIDILDNEQKIIGQAVIEKEKSAESNWVIILKLQSNLSDFFNFSLKINGDTQANSENNPILISSPNAKSIYQVVTADLTSHSESEITETETVDTTITNENQVVAEAKIDDELPQPDKALILEAAEQINDIPSDYSQASATTELPMDTNSDSINDRLNNPLVILSEQASSNQPFSFQALAARLPMDVADLFKQYAPADNFAKDVKVTYNPSDPVTINSTVNINFPFQFPEAVRESLQSGDYAEMELPSGLKAIADGPKDLKSATGTVYGTYQITAPTSEHPSGTMKIVFNDKAKEVLGGEVDFSASFDQSIIQNPGQKIFYFPDKTNIPPFSVVIHPTSSTSISKAVKANKAMNPDTLTWNVDINKDYRSINNARVDEAFPTQVSYQSVQVYPLILKNDGTIQSVGSVPLIQGSDYTVDSTGDVTFLADINTPYRLVYTTTINDDAKPANGGAAAKIINKATLKGSNIDDIPATASITPSYSKTLQKTHGDGTYYHTKDQKYDFIIKYNYGQKAINTSQPLIDTHTGMSLAAPENATSEKPVLWYMTVDDQGNGTKASIVPEDAYTFTKEAGQFKIQFNDKIAQNRAIGIYYTLTPDKLVTANTPLENKVSQEESGNPAQVTPTFTPKVVIKNKPTVDRSAKVAKWTLTLNYNNYQLNNATFTDTITGSAKGLVSPPYAETDGNATTIPTFPTVVLKDTTADKLLVQGTDYDIVVAWSDSGSKNFDSPYNNWTISLKGDYANTNHTFSLSYYNHYFTDKLTEAAQTTFTNTMKADWTTDNQPYSSSGSNNFTDTKSEYQLGSKSGSYDPATKEITWTVIHNYNNLQGRGVAAFDKIQGNQKYVDGSMTVLRGHIDSKGDFVEAEQNAAGLGGTAAGNQIGQGYIKGPATHELKDEAGQLIGTNLWLKIGNVDGSEAKNPNNKLPIGMYELDENGNLPLNSDGSYKLTEISNWQANWSEPDSSTTDIPGWDVANANQRELVYKVEYKTSLAGLDTADQANLIAATYHNQVINWYVTPDGNWPTIIDASVSVQYGGEEANKSGTFDKNNNLMSWAVWLNRSQSTLYQATMVDTPSTNQIIVPSSIKLYQGVVDSKGEVTKGDLVAASTYATLVTTDNTGQQELKIELFKSDGTTPEGKTDFVVTKPYLVEYDTTPNFSSQTETVNNTAQLESPGGVVVGPPTQSAQSVQVQTSSGYVYPYGIKGSLTIQKQNFALSPIAGSQFQLVQQSKSETKAFPDRVVATGVTGADGKLTFANITEIPEETAQQTWRYLIKEVSTPNGYTIPQAYKDGIPIDTRTIKVETPAGEEEVSLFGDNAVTLPVFNDYTKVHVDKVNSKQENLAGAEFKLQYDNDPDETAINWVDMNNFGTLTSTVTGFDIDGSNTAGGLFYAEGLASDGNDYTGRYRLIETKAPVGYQLDATPIEFHVVRDNDADSPTYSMTSVYLVTRDSAGVASETLLPTQELNDSITPIPYITVTNYQSEAKLKKVNKAGTALSGAVFKLQKQDGDEYQDVSGYENLVSGADGYVTATDLGPGNYQFVETQAPAGYYINPTPAKFSVETNIEGQPETIVVDANPLTPFIADDFTNYQGSVTFTKKDSITNNNLWNAYFGLYDSEGNPIKDESGFDREFNSNKQGKIIVDGLKPNTTYQLKELVAADGYILDHASITFTTGDNDQIGMPVSDAFGPDLTVKIYQDTGKTKEMSGDDLVIKNQRGQAFFTKYGQSDLNDEATKEPLEGATYHLFKIDNGQKTQIKDKGSIKVGESYTGNYVSDRKGHVVAGNLRPGDYYFQEVKAPDGYLLTQKTIEFTIASELTNPNEQAIISLADQINYQGAATFNKVNEANKAVSGASFAVVDGNGNTVKTVTSDENGKVYAAGLAPGQYTFKEVATKNKQYIVNTTPIPFEIPATTDGKPAVVQALNEGFINYQGQAELIKRDEAGKVLSGATFKVVDQAGKTVSGNEQLVSDENGKVLSTKLSPGQYRFVEVKAPAGYVLNIQSVNFVIPEAAEGVPQLVTTDANGQALTQINYQGTVQLTKVAANNRKLKLANAVFELKNSANQIIYPDLTTDKNGEINFSGLVPGEYLLVETKAPSGYLLDTSPITFTVDEFSNGKSPLIKLIKQNSPIVTQPSEQSKIQGLPKLNEKSRDLLANLIILISFIILLMLVKRQLVK
ncbi:MAG: Ig-like domain-containing protein [Streptococcaceae bacterium]|nr:Ig-like domain-containing protein [Streptococcaceae bacterium]MCH4177475.1 Ig-like domain-containing protein [Streptococcaceae bacterium]